MNQSLVDKLEEFIDAKIKLDSIPKFPDTYKSYGEPNGWVEKRAMQRSLVAKLKEELKNE